MSKQVLNETAYGPGIPIYKAIKNQSNFQEIIVTEQQINDMRARCQALRLPVISAHDYTLILAAESTQSNFIISADHGLHFIADKYLEDKYGKTRNGIVVLHLGDFIHILYRIAPTDFQRILNISNSVSLILDFYHHNELGKVPEEIVAKKRDHNWIKGNLGNRLRNDFEPYRNGVCSCVREICP